MTDESFELSRRKTLAALGTIGVASAGAGLGTSAYFSDQETFENNRLVAGSLDLKVDWEEHYSDWSPDESEAVGDIVMIDQEAEDLVGQVPDGYVGLPDPTAPLIAIPMEDLEAFMDATSIEAFPDPDDDGIQGAEGFEYDPCSDGADTPEDLDPQGEGALRTLNQDTYTEDDGVKPLVALDDVKPGDFGEVTFSFHICDNPGYVWMNAANVDYSENGYTEPELDDEDEDGPNSDETVELMNTIETVWWYDTDGDNVLDPGTGETVCAHLVLDSSGSMTATDGDGVSRNEEMKTGAIQLAEAILGANPANTVGVTEFDSDANVITGQTSDLGTVTNAINGVDAQGNTAIDLGINEGNAELGECPEDARTVMIVVTDGQNNAGTGPVQTASDNAIAENTDEIFAVGTGGATQTTLEAIASPDDDAHIELTSDLTQAIANLTEVLLGEEVIFRGTLSESLEALTTDNGIPLDGNRQTPYDEIAAIGDETNPEYGERECFNASDTQYIGFAWWLPVDHANEIQTDSVSFDIGFYTEQCRHNDGSGMNSEEVQS
jgi:predicted ribosomally synthesized peptide with SipW-like signal peptide